MSLICSSLFLILAKSWTIAWERSSSRLSSTSMGLSLAASPIYEKIESLPNEIAIFRDLQQFLLKITKPCSIVWEKNESQDVTESELQKKRNQKFYFLASKTKKMMLQQIHVENIKTCHSGDENKWGKATRNHKLRLSKLKEVWKNIKLFQFTSCAPKQVT